MFPSVSCVGCVSAGDVSALQELSGCVSAFRESDSRGRLPLHAAAAQPQRDVLHAVLQGGCKVRTERASSICNLIKNHFRRIPGGLECVYFQL